MPFRMRCIVYGECIKVPHVDLSKVSLLCVIIHASAGQYMCTAAFSLVVAAQRYRVMNARTSIKKNQQKILEQKLILFVIEAIAQEHFVIIFIHYFSVNNERVSSNLEYRSPVSTRSERKGAGFPSTSRPISLLHVLVWFSFP